MAAKKNTRKKKTGGGDDPKPIYVTDPNDPKLKTYQDSLSLYNNYKELKTALSKANYEEVKDIISNNPNTIYKLLDDDKNRSILNKGLQFVLTGTTQAIDNREETPTLRSVDDFIHGVVNKNLPRQLYSETIKPTGTRTFKYAEPDPYIARRDLIGDLRVIAEYDNVKPKQPVLLTKKENNDNPLVWHDEKGKAWQQVDPELFNYKLKPKSSPIVEQPKRNVKELNQIPTLDSEIKYSRNTDIPTTAYNTPQSKYQDGVLKQDFKGVPNVEVWSKRRKDDNTLRPVALVNQAGESIDYNKYKDSNLPENFQYPEKMEYGGFINQQRQLMDPTQKLPMLDPLVWGQSRPPADAGIYALYDAYTKRHAPPTAAIPSAPNLGQYGDMFRSALGAQDQLKNYTPEQIEAAKANPYQIPTPDMSNIGYNLPQKPPMDTQMMGIKGAAGGIGALGTVIANTKRPDPMLGAMSGAAQGFAFGGPVGAIIGGLVGLGTTGINRGKYDDMMQEREKGKLKAATVFGTDLGMYKGGGNVEGEEGELNPVQLEKGEVIVMPDGSIFKTKAKKTHKQMDDDEVTDILPTGAFVASNARKESILKKKADKISLGYDIVTYEEDGNSSAPKENMLGDLFNKKKMTPAEILDIVKNKFPTNEDVEYDPFLKRANKGNLKARLPYINAVIQANLK